MVDTIMTVYGMIVDYSLDSGILSIKASYKINKCEKLIFYNIPAYGTEYDILCNQLCLYKKDGTISLNFLPGTFISMDIIEEAGTYRVERMRLDIFSYM